MAELVRATGAMTADPAILTGLRPRLLSVAFRMLGSVADVEEVVRHAFARLQVAGESPPRRGC
jgi:DNA-directed RNA polymerase specialized sigma24 family protein